MKGHSSVKAGGVIIRGLKVRSALQTGGLLVQNHNEMRTCGLKIRTAVQAGGIRLHGGWIRRHGEDEIVNRPGARHTILDGINNYGEAVGFSADEDGSIHGFYYDGTDFYPVDYPGAAHTEPAAINARGDIAGVYHMSADAPEWFPEHGFVLRDGEYTTVDVPGGSSPGTRITGMNDSGQLVGWLFRDGVHGFLATPTSRRP
jgi:hypothetical protein